MGQLYKFGLIHLYTKLKSAYIALCTIKCGAINAELVVKNPEKTEEKQKKTGNLTDCIPQELSIR